MKERMNKGYFWVMLVASLLCFSSCSDREPQNQAEVNERSVPELNTSFDVVKTSYEGQVAVLGAEAEELMPYFQKRMSNTTSSITPQTDVVLFNESMAQVVLNDTTLWESLQKHWEQNKAVAVLSPSVNAIKLFAKLYGNEITEEQIQAQKESIEGLSIYAAKADFNQLSYLRPETVDDCVYQVMDTITRELKDVAVNVTEPIVVTEAMKGNVAESVALWLNETNQSSLLRSASEGSFTYSEFTHKVTYDVTVDRAWFFDGKSFGSAPENTNLHSVIELKVYAGYDKANNRDVYDVRVNELIDGGGSYIKDRVTRTNMLYKYKYSGGNNYGPIMALDLQTDGVSLTSPAPCSSSTGTYSTTYTPASITVGGTLTGGASPSGPTVNGGFNFSYTPPKTTITVAHAEMPVDCHDNLTWVEWAYGQKDYMDFPDIYHAEWGFNASYSDPFYCTRSNCKTEQAVTFYVNNSRSLGERNIPLKVSATFQIYHEMASPWEHWKGLSKRSRTFYVNMPKVSRYFDRYTPYCYASSDFADAQSWNNLETMLKGNVNYKQFYNDNLELGATVANKLDLAAEDMWKKTVESLVEQYNGRNTVHEYVIGLANTAGKHVKSGLHIKNGKWEYVQDISQILVEQE